MFFNFFLKRRKYKQSRYQLHETLGDMSSADLFNQQTGDGKISTHMTVRTTVIFCTAIVILLLGVTAKVGYLGIYNGAAYAKVSDKNTFKKDILFASRGEIRDRGGNKIAWQDTQQELPYAKRMYIDGAAYGNILGYVKYPKKDSKGFYITTSVHGESGVEGAYNEQLAGKNGDLISERDSSGAQVSSRFLQKPIDGTNVVLTIDKDVQKIMYNAIGQVVRDNRFSGGAGALMDVKTGELISLVTYPGFDSNVFTNGTSAEKNKYITSSQNVLLNRAVSGLYTPGSTVKSYMAIGALQKKLFTPETVIDSVPKIYVQSPYDKSITYAYKENTPRGPINLYQALQFSSNIYFYYLGGGYKSFKGLGIDSIYELARLFGFEKKTNIHIADEPFGVVPNQEWKQKTFNDFWRIGDTYNTVIGQYGWQVTPLQLLRAVTVIANKGTMVEPQLMYGQAPETSVLPYDSANYTPIIEGMRRVVTGGTGTLINFDTIEIAAKSGTAQIGKAGLANSLITGFYPYKNPHYAFVFLMESGYESGAALAAKGFFETLSATKPEYLR